MKFISIVPTIFVMLAAQTGPLFPGDNAKFVADVNYPDGCTVAASATITKTWKIRNCGTVDWHRRQLKIDGDAQGFKLTKAPLFSAKAGKDVNVSVNLVIPTLPGHYQILFKQWAKVGDDWRPALPNKQGLYIDVNVK